MSITTNTTITVEADGDGVETTFETTATTNSNGPAGGPVRYSLSSGDNTLPVPTGAMGMVLTPPTASDVTKRLKHHSGETGMAMRTDQPVSFPLPTGTSSVLIHASGPEVVRIFWT